MGKFQGCAGGWISIHIPILYPQKNPWESPQNPEILHTHTPLTPYVFSLDVMYSFCVLYSTALCIKINTSICTKLTELKTVLYT